MALERDRPALALGPDVAVHVAYAWAGGRALFHAVRSRDGWIEDTVVEGGGAAPCMTVGEDGVVRIAYWMQGELRSATQVAGGWAIRTVARASPVAHCAMAIDREGIVHVAWSEGRAADDRNAVRHGFRDCRRP